MKLHYLTQGPETGDAVLMLHGFTDTHFSFSRVLPLLPASMRVIVVDQRGHGESSEPQRGYELDDFAADAIELMDALSVPRAVVVGHSFGSFVARRLAVVAPERVTGLVLVGAGPSARNDVLQELRVAVDALTEPTDPTFAREFQLSTVHRQVPSDFLERAIADSAEMPARLWQAILAGMMRYESCEDRIRCPTLVLGGDRDSVFSPSEMEELARKIPGAQLKVYTNVGHAFHWEYPEGFARELEAFVAVANVAQGFSPTPLQV